jgi:hypothetical protein
MSRPLIRWIGIGALAVPSSMALAQGGGQAPYENAKIVAFAPGKYAFRLMGPQVPFIPCNQPAGVCNSACDL